MWGEGSGGWGGQIDSKGGDCEVVGHRVSVRVVGRAGKISSYSIGGLLSCVKNSLCRFQGLGVGGY